MSLIITSSADRLVAKPATFCDGHEDGSGFVFVERTSESPYAFAKPCPCAASWAAAKRFNALALPPALRSAAEGRTRWDGQPQASVHADVGTVVDGPLGCRGLLFMGPWNGTGKSHMAAVIATRWVEQGRSAVWLRWGAFLRDVRKTWGASADEEREWDLVERLMRVDLLVVDDLKPCSDRVSERLVEDIVGARAEAGGTMVVTTNMVVVTEDTPAQYRQHDLAAGIGGRAFSRTVHACRPLLMRGDDKRMG